MKAIPQLTIQLNGVIQPVTMPTKEHLMICIKRNPMIVGETKSSSKPTNIVQECDAVQGATELEKDNNVKSGQMQVKNGDGVLGLNEKIHQRSFDAHPRIPPSWHLGILSDQLIGVIPITNGLFLGFTRGSFQWEI